MDRIFGLDIQLGFDVILQAIAVFILFTALSYLLFEPVRKILEDRKNKIAGELDDAATSKEEAERLKAEYEAKLGDINKEADEILSKARREALKKEEDIVAEAKEEAARLMDRASREIELEKHKVKDQVKREMLQISVAMAGKFISDQIDEEKQNRLLEETLKEMGETTWQS